MKNEDIALIQRIVADDENAFVILVRKYQKQVHAHAWRKTGDFHIAEDITQETFLQVYQKLETLEDPTQFSRWLHVIVNRLCIAWHRKNKIPTESLDESDISEIETDAYSRYVAAYQAKTTGEAQRDLVKKLLERLNKSDREVITLHYFEEMTSSEIGTYLGMSENTIKSRLHRARQRLKKYEFMIQEELDITIEREHLSPQPKGEISMADEVKNQSEVDARFEELQDQITDLKEQINAIESNLDISIDSHKGKILNALFQLHHGSKDPVTWCYGGAYRAASGQTSKRGSIWTDSVDSFLSRAPDAEIVNFASVFTNTTVVGILRQLVEGKKSVENLAKGCDVTESEIEKVVNTLMDANLASRTEDNLIEPINDAVFFFLNFVGMTRVHLDPKDH